MEKITYTTVTATANVVNSKIELGFKWKEVKKPSVRRYKGKARLIILQTTKEQEDYTRYIRREANLDIDDVTLNTLRTMDTLLEEKFISRLPFTKLVIVVVIVDSSRFSSKENMLKHLEGYIS